MEIQDYSQTIFLAILPLEPEMGRGIRTLLSKTAAQQRHLVVSFEKVDMLTSGSIRLLMNLKKALEVCGRRLVFYDAKPYIKKLFKVMGLEEFFEIAEDLNAALRLLEQ